MRHSTAVHVRSYVVTPAAAAHKLCMLAAVAAYCCAACRESAGMGGPLNAEGAHGIQGVLESTGSLLAWVWFPHVDTCMRVPAAVAACREFAGMGGPLNQAQHSCACSVFCSDTCSGCSQAVHACCCWCVLLCCLQGVCWHG